MVKKTSLFQKLKGRFTSGSVRVEEPRTVVRGSRAAAPAGASRTASRVSVPEPKPAAEPAARIEPMAVGEPLADARSSRKLSSREEAALTLGEGFKELCSLMRGVQVRIDAQGDKNSGQIAALQKLASQLEKQGQNHELMVRSLATLPDMMKQVQTALERTAQADERTASTLGEFRSTMERVQGSMTQMVEQSRKSADAAGKLAEEQKSGTERLAKVLEERSKDGETMRSVVQRIEKNSTDHMTALRLAQQDQSTRMHKLVAQSSTWNKAILAVLVLTFLALAGVFFVMLGGR